MKNITAEFENTFIPVKALVINKSVEDDTMVYVEAYDIARNGKPANARPLSINEMQQIAECFQKEDEAASAFLRPANFLSTQVLYIKPGLDGFAIWFTPSGKRKLLFKKQLMIPNGTGHVPAMIWKADREELSVFALNSNNRPTPSNSLFHAPFFNINEAGKVCMGTVDIQIDKDCCLESFMKQWEGYFWSSYFSHLLITESPVNGNIVLLWDELIRTGAKFPAKMLKKTLYTLKDLII